MATSMSMMQIPEWDVHYFWMMTLMWIIMMIGMMLPSAIPMIMIYVNVVKKADNHEAQLISIAVFVCGYIVIWIAFSLLATIAQWSLNQAALISSMMVINNTSLSAALLIAAGVYQWMPIKESCLDQCRSPVHFISTHWKPGILGAFNMGLKHGMFCQGCCWLLMCLLFVGGVMNLLWIAIITLFVLIEKILPFL